MKKKIEYAIGKTSIGLVLAAESSAGLCAVLLEDDPETLEREILHRFPEAKPGKSRWLNKVIRYIEDPSLSFDFILDEKGTDFQKQVWKALRQIPMGTTASYGEIANKIGKPKAARAVGTACGANHISVVTPCHRVLRGDGTLSGYYWGTEKKRKLLHKENCKIN